LKRGGHGESWDESEETDITATDQAPLPPSVMLHCTKEESRQAGIQPARKVLDSK